MSIPVSGTNQLSIPQEIWSLVFSYVPLEDRKNVRLTCRRFYDACCTYQIQKNEEIVFHGNFNTHSAIQSLCNNERKVWNIKLCEVHLNDSILPFFEKHCADIHSLNLVNCVLYDGVFRNILECCRNLYSFAYKDARVVDINSSKTLFTELEVLQSRRILFTKVRDLTLEVRIYSPCFPTNKDLLRFFASFPNIKKLNLSFIITNIDGDFEESSSLSPDVTSDKVFSVSCIYHQLLRIRDQLEELSVNIWYDRFKTGFACETLSEISSMEMKNLKKFSSNCNIPTKIPFSYFQHLTDLNCVISHPSYEMNEPISAKVLRILNSASRLYSLTVKVSSPLDHPFMMSKECFIALVKSQLKTLNIWKNFDFCFNPNSPEVVKADFHPLFLYDSIWPNYTLNHLNIRTDDPTLMLLFAKYFLCLENMCVKNAREDILFNIFNRQIKLRSLDVYHCERYPLSRISPKDNPFEDRLRNLEISPFSLFVNLIHLRIVDNISLDLSRFMLSKFVLSKLKSLTIEMEDTYPKMNCDIDAFWQMIQKSTQLENLKICWRTAATFQQWLKLFESLPKLRHFSCLDSCLQLFDDSEYRLLFHTRSSLRSVCHSSRKTSHLILYVNDIIRNEIMTESPHLQCECTGLRSEIRIASSLG